VLGSLEKNKEVVANFVPPPALPHWVNGGLEIAISRKYFITGDFIKAVDDSRCEGGKKLFVGNVFAFRECKDRCIDHEQCSYFTFWFQSKKCETYDDCRTVVKESKRTQVWVRYSTCEMSVAFGSRPPNFLSIVERGFRPGLVTIMGPNRNTECACMTEIWMICAIFVEPGSDREKELNEKLDRNDPTKMRPTFAIMDSDLKHVEPPIITRAVLNLNTEDMTMQETIYAEIQVMPYSQCIHVSLCSAGTPGGICPVLGTHLQTGEAVYILKVDVPTVNAGKPVVCITAAGLRTVATADSKNDGIKDPLGRESDRPLFLKDDYLMYFIFEEEELASGICGNGAIMPAKSKPRKKSGKKKSKASEEADPAIELQENFPPTGPPTPSKPMVDPIPADAMSLYNPGAKILRKASPKMDHTPLAPPSLSSHVSLPLDSPEPLLLRSITLANVGIAGEWIQVGPKGKKMPSAKYSIGSDSSKPLELHDADKTSNEIKRMRRKFERKAKKGVPEDFWKADESEQVPRQSAVVSKSTPLNPNAKEFFPQGSAPLDSFPQGSFPWQDPDLLEESSSTHLPSPKASVQHSKAGERYSFVVDSDSASNLVSPETANRLPERKLLNGKKYPETIPDSTIPGLRHNSQKYRVQSGFRSNGYVPFYILFIFILFTILLTFFCQTTFNIPSDSFYSEFSLVRDL